MLNGKQVWDCFTFFDELELLEIRLHELDPIVDKVVICEATKTFSGRDKPLYYEEAADLAEFKPFHHKIVHIVVRDMPTGENRWAADFHQRDQIARAWEHAKDDDLILVSDADEIPRLTSVVEAAARLGTGFLRLEFRCFFYYVNGLRTRAWKGTMAGRAQEFRQIRSGDYLRWKDRNQFEPDCGFRPLPTLDDAGWHFSYLGGPARVARKLHSFAHSELDTPENTTAAAIVAHAGAGLDPSGCVGPEGRIKTVPLDESFPAYLLANLDKFSHLVAPEAHDGL